MKALKTAITALALAIAVFAMHLTAASAFADVECEGVEPTPLHRAIDAGDYEESRKQITARNGQYVNVIASYEDGDSTYCKPPSIEPPNMAMGKSRKPLSLSGQRWMRKPISAGLRCIMLP